MLFSCCTSPCCEFQVARHVHARVSDPYMLFLLPGYDVLHLHTVPYQIKHLALGNKPRVTLKVKHLLTVGRDGLILMGMEVYVYLAIRDAHVDVHVFVLKVDTTGLQPRNGGLRVGSVVAQFLEHVMSINPLKYLDDVHLRRDKRRYKSGIDGIIERLQTDPGYYDSIPYYGLGKVLQTASHNLLPHTFTSTTRLCLFTRAGDDYLFPLSHKNPDKHGIDGTRLFQWWINTIDGVLDDRWHAKVLIPGSDVVATRKYIAGKERWLVGLVYGTDPVALAVHSIPVLPDDPKGRFLEHLVVEGRHRTVSVAQFWEELGFRQEFRLGNLVGIIGCEREKQGWVYERGEWDAVSLKVYKAIVLLIKGELYNEADDVVSLVRVQLPEAFKRYNVKARFASSEGGSRDKAYSEIESLDAKTPVNVLQPRKRTANFLEPKKAPATVNVLEPRKKAPVNVLEPKKPILDDPSSQQTPVNILQPRRKNK